jgi:DNA repair protein RecO (recombination protein O)
MYLSTRGIVFRQTRYSDSSLVVKILTEELGLQSYMVKGARGPRAKIKSGLFQPLSLLELVVSHNEKKDLHHIREARVAVPFFSIHNDIRKSSILLFLDELLVRSIQEESANAALFSFIYDHLVFLDRAPEAPGSFHLLFAVHLTRFLGFFPQGEYVDEHTVFDLEEGHFSPERLPAHENQLRGALCRHFSELIPALPSDAASLSIPPAARPDLLEALLRYYQLHLPLPGPFKSPAILHEVLQK